jgi:hypothetical protein
MSATLWGGVVISSGLQMTPDAATTIWRGAPKQPLATRRPSDDRERARLAHEASFSERRASNLAKRKDAEHESAAELLADWRSAERDSAAAHEAASVAARAVTAAAAAEEAATEAEAAALEATDAAARAKEAAERAKAATSQAAEAAQLAASTTEDDQARADQTVEDADRAEREARDRFHSAQDDGFPKE